MSYRPYYAPGDNNAICDACGRVFKASQLRKRWDGFMVCDAQWEPRHPQDFVRGLKDTQVPVISRPEQADQFINPAPGLCTLEGLRSIAGVGVAGCMVAGRIV